MSIYKKLFHAKSAKVFAENAKSFSLHSLRFYFFVTLCVKHFLIFRGILIVFLSLICFNSYSQDHPSLTKLRHEIKKLSEDSMFKYGQIGFSLRSHDGKVLLEQNSDKSLIPASNLKIVTTITALKILGEDFRFETKLSYDGIIKDGVLDGNVYIEGGGDPTLGSNRIEGNPDFEELISLWTQKIKEAGIKKVSGRIIADHSIFDKNSIPDGWIWGDIGNYFGAGAWGLNVNENLYKITFKPGKSAGDQTQILKIFPQIPDMQFDNKVTTAAAGTGDNAYIYGSPYTNYRYISGTIPAGAAEFSIKGSMPDPPYLCAYSLYKSLSVNGVEVSSAPLRSNENVSASIPIEKKMIYLHKSPELKEIIKQTNVYSLNLYAEALLNMIGLKTNLSGDAKSGIKGIKEYWKNKGMDVKGWFMYDGSGLSGQNTIRPSQFTTMLYLISQDSAFNSFYCSLPVAGGEKGTLSKICKGTSAENNIIAKSGTIAKVVCYSGYVRSKKGQLNTFSIMINNYEGTASSAIRRIEKIMVLMAEM